MTDEEGKEDIVAGKRIREGVKSSRSAGQEKGGERGRKESH